MEGEVCLDRRVFSHSDFGNPAGGSILYSRHENHVRLLIKDLGAKKLFISPGGKLSSSLLYLNFSKRLICIIPWCVQWRNGCFRNIKLSFFFFFSAPHFETPLLDQHPRTREKGKGKSYQTCPRDFTFVLEGAPFGAVASLGEQTFSPSSQYNPPCLPRVLGVEPGSCAPGPAPHCSLLLRAPPSLQRPAF